MAKNIFFNRELSWIEFNARVLHEATRKDLPLFERLNFLAITSSNFDEFFQVRVATVKSQAREMPFQVDKSGLPPSQVLAKISKRCHQLNAIQNETLFNGLLPALSKKGISYVPPENFSAHDKSFTENLFRNEFFPLLTPLRASSQDFPHIGNLKINAAFLLEEMKGVKGPEKKVLLKSEGESLQKQLPWNSALDGGEEIALVQVPSAINNLVFLNSSEKNIRFTLLEDIILENAKELFPGYNIKESLLFKIVRDADEAVDEESGRLFIQNMEELLEKRQFSSAVRMICTGTSEKLVNFLSARMDLSDQDIYQVKGIIDPCVLLEIKNSKIDPDCFYPEWKHYMPADLPEDEKYWSLLKQKDLLINLPYESFDPIVKFISDAAKDKNVLAIKMTLYRPGNKNPIVQSLIDAARQGKQVTAFVEVKARFDEKQNIQWAQELEKAGAIVVFGIVNLKVHAKACLVVRKESDGIRRYVNLSTGNYNSSTSKIYQDFSLLSANQDLARDVTYFFNTISGYSAVQTMHHLFMAPVTLKSKLVSLIDREIQNSSEENPGLIVAKMNNLSHPEIIEKLYEAARHNVKIKLNVRGICTLIPGKKNLSENIEVLSVIDRYLEHSRAFYFKNGGKEEIYLSSADWMERNLDRRIELLFQITDKEVFKTIKKSLELYFQDNTHSHTLLSNGKWKANAPEKKELAVRVQEILQKKYKKISEAKKNGSQTDFQVRRKD